MFYDRIVNGCIVLRLASASLFKHIPDEVSEVYSFDWFLLPEVINVVFSRFAVLDQGKYL